jgi:outer membrane protein assembly factor BamB
MIETKPLLLNNEMYFGCWDSYFYSIDVRSGLLIWKWHANDNFYYSPAAVEPVTDGKRIYITTPEKYLYALDARLGTLEWKKENYNAWESVGISNDNRLLYVKSYKDHFHIVSTITSNWVRDIDMKFGIDTMPTKPIEWKDYILFGSKSGFVYRIDKKWNFEPVLYLGPARVHSVQHVRDNIFLASNMDGRIVLFKL